MTDITAKDSIKAALESLEKLNFVTQNLSTYSYAPKQCVDDDLNKVIAIENRASMQFDYDDIENLLRTLLSNYYKVEENHEDLITL